MLNPSSSTGPESYTLRIPELTESKAQLYSLSFNVCCIQAATIFSIDWGLCVLGTAQ